MPKKITKIYYTSIYLKHYQKLPKNIQALQDKKEKWFKDDPFNPRLKTHKLKGKYRKFFSYSVARSFRVLFRFISENEVIFYDIGTHEIYR